ncbi:uncharacterized protein BDV17DRAFT_211142 [Aspergillus undulatus]|uniref:uncharacterized protein n=1 Tax=Aspergillus undulatus TaxID=1810928 RepID=UPI003CCDA8FD
MTTRRVCLISSPLARLAVLGFLLYSSQLLHRPAQPILRRSSRLLLLMASALLDICSIHDSRVETRPLMSELPSGVTSCLQRRPYRCTSYNSLISITHAQQARVERRLFDRNWESNPKPTLSVENASQ